MKTRLKLILFGLIVLTALTTLPETCSAGTAAADTARVFDLKLLPRIERDLQLCDLFRERNILLTAQVAQRTAERDQERREKLDAMQQAKKEKRKRIVGGILRTVAEVAAVIIVIKTL